MVDQANKELAKKMDQELAALLDRSPYKLVKRTPDATATTYLVRRAAQSAPAAVPAPVAPAKAQAPPPAPSNKASGETKKPSIVVNDTNLSPSAHKIPAEVLSAMGFAVEQHHKANLSSEGSAHINFLTDAASWKSVFESAAGTYVAKSTELAKRYRESRRELRIATAKALGQAAAIIERFATMLADTQKKHGEPLVALLIFDEYRLSHRVPLHDVAESTESIARFTHELDAVVAAAQTLVARLLDGKRLLAKMEDAGFALEWINKSDQRLCAQHFDHAGKAMGPPQRLEDSF
jgi:hypothetical protein